MNRSCSGGLIFCFIIFQHYTLVTFAAYELTLGTVAGLLLMFFLIARTSYGATTGVWCALIVTSGLAVITSGYHSGSAYVTTALLFLLTSAVICAAFGSIKRDTILSTAVKNAAFVALLIVVTLSVVQVVGARLGVSSFYNIFGSHQYFHEYEHYVGVVDFPRAQGFYLEPSYNAFVIGSVGVFLLTLKWKIKSTLILTVTGVLASQSATALILLAGILLIALFRARIRVAAIAAIITSLVVAFSGTYLMMRLQTITTEGSSAYYRVIAPFEIIVDVLSSAPAGKPFGSLEETVAQYDLFMAGVQATSLDNGFYVVIYYFGWAGLAALIALTVVLIKTLLSKPSFLDGTWVGSIWIYGALSFSGAIMTPQFGLTVALIIIAIRTQRMDAKVESQSSPTAVGRHGHLSGRARTESHSQILGGPRPSTW